MMLLSVLVCFWFFNQINSYLNTPHLPPPQQNSPDDIRQTPLQPRAFEFEHLDALEEEEIALKLARALHHEDEMIPHSTQLHLVLELVMPQAFARHCVLEWVQHHSLLRRLLSLPSHPRVFTLLLLLCAGHHVLESDDAFGKTSRELPGGVAENGLRDHD